MGSFLVNEEDNYSPVGIITRGANLQIEENDYLYLAVYEFYRGNHNPRPNLVSLLKKYII